MQPWAEWNVPSRLAGKSIKHAHFVWFMSFSCMYMSVHHLKTCQCAKRTVNTSRFLSSVDGQPGLTASLTLTMKRVAPSPLPLDFINTEKFEVRQRSASTLLGNISRITCTTLATCTRESNVLNGLTAALNGADLAAPARNCAL